MPAQTQKAAGPCWRPGPLGLWGLLLALSLSLGARAQVLRYRSGPGRPLYTARQLDSLVQARQARLTAQGMLLEKKVVGPEQRHDTLLYTYALRVTTAAVQANEQRYQALVDKPLPDFRLRDLAGRLVTAASLRGRPAVLNLWFTSCPPCLAEIPALNQARARYPGVTFLALTYEPRAQVQAFLQARPFTWQHLPAAGAYCARFTQDYPISVFVDRQGIIRQIIGGMPQSYDSARHQATGEVNPAEFLQALQQLVQ